MEEGWTGVRWGGWGSGGRGGVRLGGGGGGRGGVKGVGDGGGAGGKAWAWHCRVKEVGWRKRGGFISHVLQCACVCVCIGHNRLVSIGAE